MTTTRYGPNSLLPCGTPSARRRHAAHGELCLRCEPTIERPGVCPVCKDRITVLGDRYERHEIDTGERCPGSNAPARPISPMAAQFRARRKALGWTQADLGKRAGLAQSVIASFEAGVSPLRAGNQEALAAALGLEISVSCKAAS